MAAFKMTGTKTVARKYAKAAKNITSNHIGIVALSAGGGILKTAMALQAPKDTGLLAKSMVVKPGRSKVPNRRVVVIGPRSLRVAMRKAKSGNWRRVSKKKLAEGDAGVRYMNPGKYAHLVEFGHGGKRPAPPHPFMRPAFDSTASAAAKKIETKLWELLDKEMKSVH